MYDDSTARFRIQRKPQQMRWVAANPCCRCGRWMSLAFYPIGFRDTQGRTWCAACVDAVLTEASNADR